jgi:hypothetical protein
MVGQITQNALYKQKKDKNKQIQNIGKIPSQIPSKFQ